MQALAIIAVFIAAVIAIIRKQAIKNMGSGGGTAQPSGSDSKPVDSEELASAFREVANEYGKSFAQTLEKLFRLETAHFKSGQWLKCLTPGMVMSPGQNSFPYGWSSLKSFVAQNGLVATSFGTVHFGTTSDNKPRTYITFPSATASIKFTAWFIATVRGGDFGKWYSLDKEQGAKYMAKINTIKSVYV